MNPQSSAISFPHRPVELKVKRTRAPYQADPAAARELPAAVASDDSSIASDLEALRACEDNLRAYEARLRDWQAELEQAQERISPRASAQPWVRRAEAAAPAQQDAWQKLLRARELLEVEQKNLRDDRITLQGFEQQLKERANRLAEREASVAAREQALAATRAAAPAAPTRAKKPATAIDTLTRAPFALAKSVFGAKA